MKKIKNPLIKRIPKELAGDWKKYMVVFLFLMLTSADESITEYKQEDGHFELNKRADDKLIEAIQDNSDAVSVTLYENFYRNEDEDYNNDGSADGTIRVYTKTEDINLASLCDGEYPKNKNEIAIDRMHADNVGIKTGDTIKVGNESYKVTGLIAYVNYSTLHEKTTSLMLPWLHRMDLNV